MCPGPEDTPIPTEFPTATMYEFWHVPEPGHRGAPPNAVGGLALYSPEYALGLWLDEKNWQRIADVIVQGDMIMRARKQVN